MNSTVSNNVSNSLSIKIGYWSTIAILFLLPLIYLSGYISFGSLRYYVFGTTSIFLGVLTIYNWFKFPSIPRVIIKDKLLWGMLLYFFVFLLASIASIDKVTSFFSTFQRNDGFFAVFFVTLFSLNVINLVYLKGYEIHKTLIKSSVIGSAVLSLLIILSPDGIGNLFSSSRGGATVGNSSVAASYIVFNLFFSIYLISTEKNKIYWIISLIVIICSPLFINWHPDFSDPVSIIGTARGALLGIIYGAIISLGTFFSFQRNRIKKIFDSSLLILITISTLILGIKLLDNSTKLHKSFIDVASETRFIFWDVAMKGFNERPILGWGPGTFDTTYHMFFEPRMLLLLNGGEMWVDRTHNIFFETLTTGGILLMMGLLAFLSSIVYSIVRLVRNSRVSIFEGSVLMGLVFAWLFQAQFIFESLLSIVMLFFVASICISLNITSVAQIPKVKQNPIFIISTCIISIFLFVYVIAIPHSKDLLMTKIYNTNLPARAGMWNELKKTSPVGNGYDSILMFNKVYQAYNSNVSNIKMGDENLRKTAIKELDEITNLMRIISYQRPNDYGINFIGEQLKYIRMQISSDYSQAHIDDAHAFSQRALNISPNDPQVYWLIAQLNIINRDYNTAKKMLEISLGLEPRLDKTHNLILSLGRLMGDDFYFNSSLNRAKLYLPEYTFNK